MGKNAVSRSFAKEVPERVYTRRKGLLLAATSLINFLGLTRYRVKSIAPTGLSRMSPFSVDPNVTFRAGFQYRAANGPENPSGFPITTHALSRFIVGQATSYVNLFFERPHKRPTVF